MLCLSAVQSAITYSLETRSRTGELEAAAERSAAVVRARLASGEILLQTLSPGSVGLQCAQRLADARRRLPGYANLIAFDAAGRVICAAAATPPDPARAARPWFRVLARGDDVSVSGDPGAAYAHEPSLVASVRAQDDAGRFTGVMSAILPLASLTPGRADVSAPANSDVALADGAGRLLTWTRRTSFPAAAVGGRTGSAPRTWVQRDATGKLRFYIASPLSGRDLYVVLSSPYAAVSWTWINPLAAVLLPLLAYVLALAAVLLVADREIVRWIAYLSRVAAIYARGRYTVHPRRAQEGPPEIRELAGTMDAMAGLIAERDSALKINLAEKDGLMREIHHRVKNNLQVISSLLSMQQRSLSDPAARAAMSDTRQRITALSLVYRALYQGPDLKRVDLREFMEDLIAHLVLAEAGGSAIDTRLSLDTLTIDPDRLAPLALFAVEAITNARKHGLGERGGRLAVAFRVLGEKAELTITDSGREGGPAPSVGAGVGRTLMTAFARQLRGELSFSAEPGGGLTARLIFPVGPHPA
ncbi:MAG TPA: histidine kinase dimerization/phosphoacceptor domain -containing protein [Caulobacteraceae bacterium]|nr:histidine kinase dimerization/phosphoacceptor domain -containing protein [Caulobacteraceae bacterium]